MLDFILRLLSVLGIVLLVIILLLLVALLLVLFFPITYRIRCRKTADETELSARLNWLFGLLRARCSYPEPGMLTAKFLWFRIYQMKLPPDHKETKDTSKQTEEKTGEKKKFSVESGADTETKPGAESRLDVESKKAAQEKISGEWNSEAQNQEKFFKKIKKIKYTICCLYDKIKEIWKNISYYTALLQEEDTRQLWAYVKLRVAKVLKNIRPRHISADILFGMGSPDMTGYVFGMYCMFYPVLGGKVLVTPDFERSVLEGRADISGHITIFVLVVNIVRLIMDKKLQMFIRKLKKRDTEQDKISH